MSSLICPWCHAGEPVRLTYWVTDHSCGAHLYVDDTCYPSEFHARQGAVYRCVAGRWRLIRGPRLAPYAERVGVKA